MGRPLNSQKRQPAVAWDSIGLNGISPAICLIALAAGLLLASYGYQTPFQPQSRTQTLVAHSAKGLSMGTNAGAASVTHISRAANISCCLAMIIKNEGPIIPRLFESVKGFASQYCIVDTGSTDDTIDVVKSMDMPGVVFEEPFVDFATSRNYMMDRCREASKADYFLLLDGDMVLHVADEWDWAKLDGKDVYNLIQIWGVEYENVRLVRREATADIRVVGSTHEFYDVPPNYTHGLLPKSLLYIEDVGDGKAKADKFERDERLLRKDLVADPNNGRAIFYLGNTLRSLGRYEEAIDCYLKRASMQGWFADRDYSIYQTSTCYLALDKIDEARRYAEVAAFDGAVPRAEPLYDLVFYLHRQGNHSLAWYYLKLAERIPKPQVAQALFISNDIYDYWLPYERATLCRHVFSAEKHLRPCPFVAMLFLSNIHAPDHLRGHFVRHDLGFGVKPLPGRDFPIQYDDQNSCSRAEFALDPGAPRTLALFTVSNTTYCVQQWQPLLVGQYEAASGECRLYRWSTSTPRALSFLTTATDGAMHDNEIWFLAQWMPDANDGVPMFSFVVLRDNGNFKAHTVPFTIGFAEQSEEYDDFISVISVVFSTNNDHGDAIDILYHTSPRDCHARMHRIALVDAYTLIV